MMRRGFSLVELSIVLVILGLLTGGILAGQSLIHAAELRAVVTEQSRFVTALRSFHDKYMGIPGDLRTATRFWGDDNTNCPDPAVTNGSPGTCNGNGNGQVVSGSSNDATAEMFQFWKQLALAGLIEGTYSGLAGSANGAHAVIGNSPQSRMNLAMWGTYYTGQFPGSITNYQAEYGNHIMLGEPTATGVPMGIAFIPEDAWNIDTKLDDGKPGTGIMITNWNNCTTSTGFSDYTGNYAVTTTGKRCVLYFLRQY